MPARDPLSLTIRLFLPYRSNHETFMVISSPTTQPGLLILRVGIALPDERGVTNPAASRGDNPANAFKICLGQEERKIRVLSKLPATQTSG
jgi:hypothetical protein